MDTASLRNVMNQKISELIFEQMFLEAGKYTIVPIGYDRTVPELSPFKRHVYVKKILDNLKAAPDFVLISQDKTDVIVVEVEYMPEFVPDKLGDMVHTILRRWDPSYVFLATQHAFYFEHCSVIKQENGHISSLSERWVRLDIQNKYLDLLHHYLR
jgi:hypothetical protein